MQFTPRLLEPWLIGWEASLDAREDLLEVGEQHGTLVARIVERDDEGKAHGLTDLAA